MKTVAFSPSTRPTKRIRLIKARRLGITLLATILSLFVIIPFAWVLFTAVKTRQEIARNPLGVPGDWHLENFLNAWKVGRFDRYFMNSVYVVIPTVLFVLFLSLLIAYAFSLMSFRGKRVLFAIFLLGLAIPLDILIIPLFYSLLRFGLLNTPWALILPISAKIIPFGVLLLRGFIDELPQEILDAGLIDGCSRIQLLRNVVVPLSWPAIASLLVFTFMWTWNTFFLPIVVIQEDAKRTLPVGLNYFQSRYETDIPLLMAGAIISCLPIIIIYLIFQRQFIRGITAGAIK
jgi:raffinose/stachyose/melibiose transport system permease protein